MSTPGGGFGFPFAVDAAGSIAPEPDESAQLRGQLIQVLFTAPGERVNQPEFGCGLFNLVFDPNNMIMAAAAEFTIGQALARWLGDALVVAGVDVQVRDEVLAVEVAYVRRRDGVRQAVRVQFR
jgi:phage baseplate assembly protein W